MLQLYIDLASSRLACRDIQRIQRIQPIQLYSYTRYTAYSTIQPPSGRGARHRAARTHTVTNTVFAAVFGLVLAVWRLAIAVAEPAGLEFGARVRRAHVEGHLVRACPGTCNPADVFMNTSYSVPYSLSARYLYYYMYSERPVPYALSRLVRRPRTA